MPNKVEQDNKQENKLTVILALLRKDLIRSVLLCDQYHLEHEIIDENNLRITLPKESIHLLFYIGQKLTDK